MLKKLDPETMTIINSALANGYFIDVDGRRRTISLQVTIGEPSREIEGIPIYPDMGLPPVGRGYYTYSMQIERERYQRTVLISEVEIKQ